jgi:hypothetical protein
VKQKANPGSQEQEILKFDSLFVIRLHDNNTIIVVANTL